MKSTGSAVVDAKIKRLMEVKYDITGPMPCPDVQICCIPDKEVFTPLKKILRGEAAEKYNKGQK